LESNITTVLKKATRNDPIGATILEGKDIVSQSQTETPFDSIESSHQYVALLAQAIEEASLDVEGDVALAMADRADRRREALQLVLYNLTKLESHMSASRRILNDLRTLRRLLLEERDLQTAPVRTGAARAGA
jgi:hypothetical protein